MKKRRSEKRHAFDRGSEDAAVAQPEPLHISLARTEAFGSPLEGEPDLSGTRAACLGVILALIAFATFVSALPKAVAQRFSPEQAFGVDVLIVVLLLLILGMVVAVGRTFIMAGAWFHIDQRGFAYGTGLRAAGTAPESLATYIAWSQIERQPAMACDVSIENSGRVGALNPTLRFWYRSKEGTLTQYAMPIQLRRDPLRCLRFRNSHALRVVLLQRLASMGLRFEPDVFIEAAVDPETWERRTALRYVPWVGTGLTLASLFLVINITWPLPWIILCTVAIMAIGFGVTTAMMRRDRRLRGVITYTQPPH